MDKPRIEIVRRDTNFDIKNVKLFEVTGKTIKRRFNFKMNLLTS